MLGHLVGWLGSKNYVMLKINILLQLKELKERQKQQLRHKALKKGLDPEALTGKYPVSASLP